MSQPYPSIDSGRTRDQSPRTALAVLAAIYFAAGMLAIIAPHTFFKLTADFGAYSEHSMRDTATFYIAIAIALSIAMWRRQWRIPVLTVTAVQNLLHSINQLTDLDHAQHWWVGLLSLIGFLALTGLCFWTGVREARAAWHRKLAFFRSRLRN